MLLKDRDFQSDHIPNNGQHYFQKIKCWQKLLLLAVFQIVVFCSYAQYYEQKPEPEFGIGIKVAKGKIIYGQKSFYITDPNSIFVQALARRDAPIKIFSRSPYQQRYINFVLESGFLFCKANVFDSVLIDPITNTRTREKSRNPIYLPIYAGLYNRSAFSIGAEVFYWKGLGVRDICGAKFLSLGYNGQSFRITASGEWYTQIQNTKNSGFFISINFLWKLIVDD